MPENKKCDNVEGDMITSIVTRDLEKENRELAAEIARYKYFFDESPMGIYRTTPDGRILLCNDRLAQKLGYENAEELMTRNLEKDGGFETVSPRTQFKEIIDKQGEIKVSEAVWKKKDGTPVYIRENARAVHDDEGNILYYEGTVEDITELKKMEQAKDDFISTAAHELRTPMTALAGYLSLLEKDKASLPPREQGYVDKLIRAQSKLHEIVEDLLSVLRLEHGPKSDFLPFNLRPVLEEAVNQWQIKARNENKIISLDDGEDYEVYGNQEQTKKIVSNLVSNAVKYTQAKGLVHVSVAKSLHDHEPVVEITVADNGIGIPRESQKVIFDKFYRVPNDLSVKAGGTGLGLYIVKQLVQMQGGQIWVESEEGRGSQFRFTLPLLEKSLQLPLLKN